MLSNARVRLRPHAPSCRLEDARAHPDLTLVSPDQLQPELNLTRAVTLRTDKPEIGRRGKINRWRPEYNAIEWIRHLGTELQIHSFGEPGVFQDSERFVFRHGRSYRQIDRRVAELPRCRIHKSGRIQIMIAMRIEAA